MFGLQAEGILPILLALCLAGNEQQLGGTGGHDVSIAMLLAQRIEQRGIHMRESGGRFAIKANLQPRIIHGDEKAEFAQACGHMIRGLNLLASVDKLADTLSPGGDGAGVAPVTQRLTCAVNVRHATQEGGRRQTFVRQR